MRIREMGWKDYNLTSKRVHDLKEYCRDGNNISMVVRAAAFANLPLSGAIVKSLTTGIGYVELSKREYIPITKVDFYAYQRRAVAILDVLIRGKALGFWMDGEAEGKLKHIDR